MFSGTFYKNWWFPGVHWEQAFKKVGYRCRILTFRRSWRAGFTARSLRVAFPTQGYDKHVSVCSHVTIYHSLTIVSETFIVASVKHEGAMRYSPTHL
jgi:hypothetical protein